MRHIFSILIIFMLVSCGGGMSTNPGDYNFILYQDTSPYLKDLSRNNKNGWVGIELFEDKRSSPNLGIAHLDYFNAKGVIISDLSPQEWVAHSFYSYLASKGYTVELFNPKQTKSIHYPIISGKINRLIGELTCTRTNCSFDVSTDIDVSFIDRSGLRSEKKFELSKTTSFPGGTVNYNIHMKSLYDAIFNHIVESVYFGIENKLIAKAQLPITSPSIKPIHTAANSRQKRYALIIGNSSYTDATLKTAVNDATDIAEALSKQNFTTKLLVNAKLREIDEAVRVFSSRLKDGSVGVFYYVGHGVQSNGRNYIIPIGANIHRETDIKYEAYDVGRLLDDMSAARGLLNVVVLDACRSNQYHAKFGLKKGFLMIDAPIGSFIAHSASPGSVVSDGDGRNGAYARNLIAAINTPNITLEQVFKKVRLEIIDESGGRQVPWETSSLLGDFYFNHH